MDFFVVFRVTPNDDDERAHSTFLGACRTEEGAQATARNNALFSTGARVDLFSESLRLERGAGIPMGYWANELILRANGEGEPTGTTYWICPQTL